MAVTAPARRRRRERGCGSALRVRIALTQRSCIISGAPNQGICVVGSWRLAVFIAYGEI